MSKIDTFIVRYEYNDDEKVVKCYSNHSVKPNRIYTYNNTHLAAITLNSPSIDDTLINGSCYSVDGRKSAKH
jgi:hypothetical protein